jgi:transcription elongation factor GreA
MLKSVAPHSVYEMLVKHLVDVEEERAQVIKKYFPQSTKEKDDYELLMRDYIKAIEGYISSAKAGKKAKGECPFVIIGSIVQVEDLQFNEVETFQIVCPYSNKDINKDNTFVDCASYLSPMGKALLLKKVNDRVTVNTPAGKFDYLIKSIEIPESMFV